MPSLNDLYSAARSRGWHRIMDRSPPGQQPQKGDEKQLVAVNHRLHRRGVGGGLELLQLHYTSTNAYCSFVLVLDAAVLLLVLDISA